MMKLIGTTIEHYQILLKIRETPTRVLYRAYNTKSHTDVALEVVKSAWLDPRELLDLINEQVRRNAELIHPNIATVSDSGLHDGLIYIVYNFFPAHLLRRFFNQTYPWKDMARELVSIAHALAYAHEKDIVHGALHPSSIVLDEKRNPILFDFGFERIITDQLLAHAPGAWVNRWGLEYRAPAQLRGAAADQQGDIYSLGIMMYEWLTGRTPREETTLLGLLQTGRKPLRFSKQAASVPSVVKRLVQKCIAPRPQDRYQSMQEVYIILARGVLDMNLTSSMVRRPLAISPPRLRLKRAQVRQIGFSVLLAVLALLMFLNRSSLYQAVIPPTMTPTLTIPPSTPTPTSSPAPTPLPTRTEIPPTPTPLGFPVFQGTQISNAIHRTLTSGNVDQMVMLSIWGMGDLHHLAASPDGRFVAVASSTGLFVFEAQSLKLERYIDTSAAITVLAFSPDSRWIASGSDGGLIEMWETRTWTKSTTRYPGHRRAVLDLAFSPDGMKLASVDSDGRLIQWQVNPAAEPAPQRIEETGQATTLTYSSDGSLIVTGGNDLLLKVWNAATLEFQQKKDFTGKIVDIVPVKGPGSLFVVGGNDQSVALWDLGSAASLQTVGRLRYPLTGVAASPDGRLIAAGDLNGGIAVWDVSSGTASEILQPKNYILGEAKDLEPPGRAHSLAFSSDGRLVYSGLHNGSIRGLDALSGQEVGQNSTLNAHVRKMEVSPDSQHLITQQMNDSLTLWNLWEGTIRGQLQGEIKDGYPFSEDGERLVISSAGLNTAMISIHDLASGKILFTLKGRPRLKAVQFVSGGTQLITLYDGNVELWSMLSGEKLEIDPLFDGTNCQAIRDINNQSVVSITNYQYVVTNGVNKSGLCTFDPFSFKYAVNEGTGQLLYGGESVLSLLNVRNPGQKALNLDGVNRKNIVSVAISPDGNLLAAAYDDDSIHIWDASTRKELTNALKGLYGHGNTVTGLRFSPDGRLLISASLDGTIRLWGVPY